jgi:hypothetical protein
MSARALLSCAAVVAICWAAVAEAAEPPFELAARKPHVFGSSRGTLVFGDEGVEYKTAHAKDARRWSYDEIQQVQILSPRRVVLQTYEDHGWTRLWSSRTFDFQIEKGAVTPDLATFLIGRISRPVLTAVLPPLAGTPGFRVLVKHVRERRGSEGELLLYRDALVYSSPQSGASRYWRFGDLVSVLPLDRYRIEVTAYEIGAGDTRSFVFQLKRDPPPGFADALWAAVNPAAPLRGDHQK